MAIADDLTLARDWTQSRWLGNELKDLLMRLAYEVEQLQLVVDSLVAQNERLLDQYGPTFATLFGSVPLAMAGLCGSHNDGFSYHCTKPKGHPGEHVATVGPWKPELPVLARWLPSPAAAPAPEVRAPGSSQTWCFLCGEGNECKGHEDGL